MTIIINIIKITCSPTMGDMLLCPALLDPMHEKLPWKCRLTWGRKYFDFLSLFLIVCDNHAQFSKCKTFSEIAMCQNIQSQKLNYATTLPFFLGMKPSPLWWRWILNLFKQKFAGVNVTEVPSMIALWELSQENPVEIIINIKFLRRTLSKLSSAFENSWKNFFKKRETIFNISGESIKIIISCLLWI